MKYSDKVMDHFLNPRNVGEIPDSTVSGTVGNPVCGDIMRIDLKIENEVIVDAKFMTFGCGAAVATSSMATEMIIGRTVQEALELTNRAVANALDGLPPIKMHCSALAEQAVKKALLQYYQEHGLLNDDNLKLFSILEEDVHDHEADEELINLPGIENQ
ncbi:MAG: Fe-S cluster assembly scaffold protein NifU [Saccharofermentanales bacterium]|jgi:nitrogen fixation NifU-like protein|nr:Fe-S cluster assembly scaffold protein NifU [Bacillota bacterium]